MFLLCIGFRESLGKFFMLLTYYGYKERRNTRFPTRWTNVEILGGVVHDRVESGDNSELHCSTVEGYGGGDGK